LLVIVGAFPGMMSAIFAVFERACNGTMVDHYPIVVAGVVAGLPGGAAPRPSQKVSRTLLEMPSDYGR
jgi:hypothetical protein